MIIHLKKVGYYRREIIFIENENAALYYLYIHLYQ
jgi:hypothetical protein